MKLDRNINPDGKGKYALIKLRESIIEHFKNGSVRVHPESAVDYGGTPETDFFVIRLKDKYAAPALHAYAEAAKNDDPEWSGQVRVLAFKAEKSPLKQIPT